ncbi:MAG: chemotaxis protein CheV [Campylobacterales bacterium]|nr:chemotaxis protein CheV [Campylobacterales bacterium]
MNFNYDDIDEEYELLNHNSTQYLFFKLSGNIYALEVLDVEQIIEYQQITKIPLLNRSILGVTNVRGSITTVIDLNMRFHQTQTPIDSKTSIIIMNPTFSSQNSSVAILVEEVLQIDGLDSISFENVPTFGTPVHKRFIKNITKYHKSEILLLNLFEVLHLEQLSELNIQENRFKKEDFYRSSKKTIFLSNDIEEDEEEDQFELDKIVSSTSSTTNQYLIFCGPKNQLYGKNISKIEEIVSLHDVVIQDNFGNTMIKGMADIRGEMLTLINLDMWLGLEEINDDDYEEIIIAKYGKQKFGLIVRSIEQIVTIANDQMILSSDADRKSTFITKISINNTEKMCTIIDSDQIIIDCFESSKQTYEFQLHTLTERINSNKFILFADDSAMIRNMLKITGQKLGLNTKVFEDGKKLYDFIVQSNTNNIGLVVTDLEMPNMDGKQLIVELRKIQKCLNTPIIVYTNMANKAIVSDLQKAGATKIITKIDIDKLKIGILELFDK